MAKKLIKSTIKKELKNSKLLNPNNNSTVRIQSTTISNPHLNSSNQQSLRNHVRNIVKAKRTLNQTTTITEEHHTQVTISSHSSNDNCSKIDRLKLLEEALPPEEYNQILNQINYNYSCFTNNQSPKNNTVNKTCQNPVNNNKANNSNKNSSNNNTNRNQTNIKHEESTNNPQTDTNHDTALTLACAHGHVELVQLLIARGSKIDHRDKKGFTPLHWAAMNGHLEIIDILVSNGADLEAEDKLSMSPLLVAAWYGHVQVVERLIALGSKPSKSDKKQQTILHCASKNNHSEVIKFLLNTCPISELSLDAKDKKCQTALHFAVINSDLEIVNRLINCGASLTIKDKVCY